MKWHYGPPPSVGWWPTMQALDYGFVRWWNGKRWSMPAAPSFTAREAAASARQLSRYHTDEIKWADRPKSWPAQSKT